MLTFARNLATKLFFDENALIRLCQRLNNERMSWMREVVNICYPISSEESEAERWQLIVQSKSLLCGLVMFDDEGFSMK